MATGNGRRKPRRQGAAATATATKPKAAPKAAPKPAPKPKVELPQEVKQDFRYTKEWAAKYVPFFAGIIMAEGKPLMLCGTQNEAEAAAWLEEGFMPTAVNKALEAGQDVEFWMAAALEAPGKLWVTLRDPKLYRTVRAKGNTPVEAVKAAKAANGGAKPASKQRTTAQKRSAASKKTTRRGRR